MIIFVGNLPDNVTPEELREHCELSGDVSTVRLVTDPETGLRRGYGFVEMPDRAQAEAAVASLNLKEIRGRVLIATEARENVARGRGNDRRPTQLYGRRA